MQITKAILKETVQAFDPNMPEDAEEFKVGMILLTALHVGANVKKIAEFLEIPVAEVKKYEKNLRKNNIWIGRKTDQEWTADFRGQVAFWLDVMVAMGRVKKRTEYRE